MFLKLTSLLIALKLCSSLDIVEQNEPSITAQVEEALELTCSTAEQWEFCKWEFKGGHCKRSVGPVQDGYCRLQGAEDTSLRWVGAPSVDHRCSLLLANPDVRRDTGEWTCRIVRDGEIATHTYDVEVEARAKVGFGGRPYKRMEVGKEYDIECVANSGHPTPTLGAVVSASDGEELLEEDFLLEAAVEDNDGMLAGSVGTVFKYEPSPERRTMFVKCLAFQGESYSPPSVAISQFEVVYPPLPNEASVQTAYVDIGLPGEVRIEFMANPVPAADEVIWHYVKDASNESFVVSPGEEAGRFRALHLETTPSTIIAVLEFSAALLEDFDHYCYLEVRNEFGRFEYNFKFVERPPPTTTMDPNAAVEPVASSGPNVGAIVGGIIGIILLLAAIAIVLFFCKSTHRLCFKQKPVGYNVDVEELDEGGGMNTTGNFGATSSRDEVDDDTESDNSAPIIRGNSQRAGNSNSYMEANSRESTYPVQ